MPATRRIGGRPWRRLRAYVIARDNGICGLCGMPGADTGGHIIALEDGGAELDPDNVRAEHGTPRTVTHHGFTCPGNYAHTTGRGPTIDPTPSRRW